MNRRKFLKAIGLSAASLALPKPFAKAEPADKPNVILIITDDQGYGDIACLGNKIIRTPNLDRLYSQSTRLTNFHVSPTCSPTRAALMTGRYNLRTGVWHTGMGRSLLRSDELTMADLFKHNGYLTAIFGKWHLGDNYPFRPQDRGFTETLIHSGGGITQMPDYWGNDYFDDTYLHNGRLEKYQGYCTDVWFEQAVKFIEENKRRPFFIYLPLNAPHSPYIVAEKYSKAYLEKGLGETRAKFYGMITNIDENLGGLLNKLEQLQIEDNTILIFTTDNGTAEGVQINPGDGFAADNGYNAEMRGKKGSQYEGGHRVPCFIKWPAGKLRKDYDIDNLTAHIDILPTLIELCGLKKPTEIMFDGTSLYPLLTDPNAAWTDRTLIVDSQRLQYPKKWRNSCVMTQKWRLINGSRLYDINADPGQKTNIAQQNPQAVRQLRNAYEKWWAGVSKQFGEYCRIIIGSDKDNPTCLYAVDWHTQMSNVPWDRRHILRGFHGNGFWTINIARDGDYEFSLMRWPKHADTPISQAPPDGRPIPIKKARLQIADVDITQPVKNDAKAATFNVKLKAGNAELKTWFITEKATTIGAYYVYITHR